MSTINIIKELWPIIFTYLNVKHYINYKIVLNNKCYNDYGKEKVYFFLHYL